MPFSTTYQSNEVAFSNEEVKQQKDDLERQKSVLLSEILILEDKKNNFEDLSTKIQEKKEELDNLEIKIKEISKVNDDLSVSKQKLTSLNKEIEEKTTNLQTLDSRIDLKNEELAKIDTKISEKEYFLMGLNNQFELASRDFEDFSNSQNEKKAKIIAEFVKIEKDLSLKNNEASQLSIDIEEKTVNSKKLNSFLEEMSTTLTLQADKIQKSRELIKALDDEYKNKKEIKEQEIKKISDEFDEKVKTKELEFEKREGLVSLQENLFKDKKEQLRAWKNEIETQSGQSLPINIPD